MALTTSGPRRDLFGDIAVGKGLLTWAQMRDALKRQARYKEMGIPIRIGEVAVEMGLLTQQQCGDILADQRERRKATAPPPKPAAAPGTAPRKSSFESTLQEWDEGSEPLKMGHYRLEKRLGGVMGIVFRGTDERDGRTVAVKVLPRSLAHDQSFVERFKREVRANSLLDHPNVVRIHDAGVENGVFFMATEFIDGETLNTRLRHDGRLNETESLRITRDVALALGHAHSRNVLHRDVKPENVMISRTGQVKLADLGLAKFLEDEQRITADGIAVGTPHYISPEQARALKTTDHRADIYSVGAMLFHLVTGRLPYEGDNGAEVMKRHVFEATPDPRSVRPDLSQPVADLIIKLMAKDPNKRFQTALELAAHIDGLLGSSATNAATGGQAQERVGA